MLKLASINIEMERHYPRVIEFVKTQQPDVVCLQELMISGVGKLIEGCELPYAHFAPMDYYHPHNSAALSIPEIRGVGILSRFPLHNLRVYPYAGSGTGYTRANHGKDPLPVINSCIQFVLITAEVEKDGVHYPIATTHFPWTPDGYPDDNQRTAVTTLLRVLADVKSFTLAGDSNAARGRGIFEEISSKYTDNIPAHYTNSLDKTLHRAGHKLDNLMVDILFTTPEYQASNVKLHSGVSDHMAITADIKRA